MYADLRIELDTNEINYKQSSNLQGIIMETIDTDYAEQLHRNQTNPYSQYITKEDGKTIWYIKTLTEEAYQKIILLMEGKKEFQIKKKGITIRSTKKKIQTIESRSLLDEFYKKECSKYIEIQFLTPTAFKQDGRYVFYPDLRLIYGSLMRKYSQLSADLDMIDEDALEELCEKSEIVTYRIQTVPFPIEKVTITGFVGKICIKIKGPETLARYIRLLVHFGEFSGVGIKTGIGMGAIKYGRKKDE